METKNYAPPTSEVMEVYAEGIFCGSIESYDYYGGYVWGDEGE